jgi:hypothetical protein
LQAVAFFFPVSCKSWPLNVAALGGTRRATIALEESAKQT